MSEGTELKDTGRLFANKCVHVVSNVRRAGRLAHPLGERCGIEINHAALIDAVHGVRSLTMDPYIDRFHDDVCTHCPNRVTDQCPCPLDALLLLAVEAIEGVDQHRQERAAEKDSGSLIGDRGD